MFANMAEFGYQKLGSVAFMAMSQRPKYKSKTPMIQRLEQTKTRKKQEMIRDCVAE